MVHMYMLTWEGLKEGKVCQHIKIHNTVYRKKVKFERRLGCIANGFTIITGLNGK